MWLEYPKMTKTITECEETVLWMVCKNCLSYTLQRSTVSLQLGMQINFRITIWLLHVLIMYSATEYKSVTTLNRKYSTRPTQQLIAMWWPIFKSIASILWGMLVSWGKTLYRHNQPLKTGVSVWFLCISYFMQNLIRSYCTDTLGRWKYLYHHFTCYNQLNTWHSCQCPVITVYHRAAIFTSIWHSHGFKRYSTIWNILCTFFFK